MKKSLLILLLMSCSVISYSQIGGCSDGIISITLTPVTGTNDIELSVNSESCNVHHLNNSSFVNNSPSYIVTLCYEDTGLTLQTTLTSTILLSNINSTGNQNIVINSNYFFNNSPTDDCSTNTTSSQNFTISFDGPLSEQSFFPLNTNSFNMEKVKLFPNPNNGVFTIKLPPQIDNAQLSIFDISGKKVYSNENYSSESNIQISNLSKGLYFVKVISNNTSQIIKFLVN